MGRRVVGLAVVVLAGLLLAFWAPPSAIIDVPAAEKSAGDGSGVTETSIIPDFYNVSSDDIPAAAPGKMIKTERIRVPRNDASVRGIELHRIMYHSTTVTGENAPVSGLYAQPAGDPPEGGWPLVGFAHGTTGAARQCGTSLTPLQPATPAGSQFARKVQPLVEQGWAVVSTDYQGMGPEVTPMYLLGETEGRNVLDSIRAVQRWRTDLDNTKAALYGRSEGGQAVLFASELQAEYAPDVYLTGVVSLAPAILPPWPAVVEQLAKDPSGTNRTYFVMLALGTWVQNYPWLTKEETLSQKGIDSLPVLEELCSDELRDYFQDRGLIKDYINLPLSKNTVRAINLNNVGGQPLNQPLLLVQGMEDVVVINQATPEYFSIVCQQGNVPAKLELYPEDDHGSVVVNARDSVNQWLQDRFEGQAPPDNCPIRRG